MKKTKSNSNLIVAIIVVVVFIAVLVGVLLVSDLSFAQYKTFEDYKEEHKIDFSYELKDYYETKEEFYQEIVNISIWGRDKDRQIMKAYDLEGEYEIYFEAFGNEAEASDLELEEFFSENYITDYSEEEIDEYKRNLLQKCNDKMCEHVDELVKRTNPNALIFDERAYQDMEQELADIGDIQEYIKSGDYVYLVSRLCNTLEYDIIYTVYPDVFASGLKEKLTCELKSDDLKKIEELVKTIGVYEVFQEDFAYAWQKIEGSSGNGWSIPSTSAGSSFGSSGSHSGSGYVDDDPYDVYDYWDPEDFYEDNYDDFYDYEDAEDYYYEAWE